MIKETWSGSGGSLHRPISSRPVGSESGYSEAVRLQTALLIFLHVVVKVAFIKEPWKYRLSIGDQKPPRALPWQRDNEK